MNRDAEIEEDTDLLKAGFNFAFWIVIVAFLGTVAFNLGRYLIERG